MPVSLTKYTIKNLTAITQEADLINKVLEVESASGTDQNFKVSVPTLVQTVANNLPGGNNAKVAVKTARFYDANVPGYDPGSTTLVGLNPDFLCLYTTCWVEFPQPNTEYILVYDGTPGATLQVWRDGTFTGGKLGAKWVPANSLEAQAQGIADFSPFAVSYDAGDNVKFLLNGSLRLFSAKVNLVKSTFMPAEMPAPTGLSSDLYWQEISLGANANVHDFLPGTYKKGDVVVFNHKLHRATSDLVIGDFINQGGTYDNFPDLDVWEIVGDGASIQNPYDDTALSARVTAVEGGVVYLATTVGDNYNELSGRINTIESIAKDYVPGSYQKGQFVISNSNLFTAKQPIQNSQVAPSVTNAYWLKVSGGGINSVIPSLSGTTLTITTEVGAASVALPEADVTKAYVDAADGTLQSQIITNTNNIASIKPIVAGSNISFDDSSSPGSRIINSNAAPISSTDALAEGSTNKYFTQERAISSPLSGLTATAGTPTATDTIITAWGKILNFFNNFSAQVRTVMLSGYLKATSSTGVADGDTFQIAVGKLEKKVDDTTTSITTLAPTASPTLTGTPTAPTATAGTNTTQLATTAFVSVATSQFATTTSLGAKQDKPAGTTTSYGAGAGQANTATNNLYLGYQAGLNNSSGYQNSHIGYQAGAAATTGYQNTNIGFGAGNKATTANANTNVGSNAGYTNITGARNTMLGQAAGYNNIQSDNTYLGFNTGIANTSGYSNTAVGSYAGYSITSGANNVMVGYQAGYSVSTGSNNIYLGYGTGAYVGGGSSNVFLGTNAGYNNSASSGVFIGESAGYSNTGAFNTFLGTNAGYSNTTGQYNAFFGYQAGRINTSGSNNIAFGYNAGPTVGTLSNTTSIGYNAKASIANTIVIGDAADATNRIGIGTTAPASKVHVVGDVEVSGGIIMKSPDGTRYRLTVANGGGAVFTAI